MKNMIKAALIPAAALLALALPWMTPRVGAQANVLTWHNDNSRTGLNPNETILTPNTVSSGRFDRLYDYPVSGQIYAQPLYASNVYIPATNRYHNIVLVATEHDMVYALDADNPTAGQNHNGVLWQADLTDQNRLGLGSYVSVTTVPKDDVNSGDIKPEIGITGTPVIDPASATLYVVAKTKERLLFGSPFIPPYYKQRLHALNIHTGQENFGGPIDIQASVPGNGEGAVNGQVSFDPRTQNQRAGLTLLNGTVYIAFASHGDQPCYHGFVLGYAPVSYYDPKVGRYYYTLKKQSAWTTTPNGNWGGIWQAGAAPATYGPYIFFETSNSSPARNPYRNADRGEYGDSFVKLSTEPYLGGLTPVDFFKPYNYHNLDDRDLDLGSGGAMLIPDAFFGISHLLVGAGKEGRMYVLNAERMGGQNAGFDNVFESLPSAAGAFDGTDGTFGNVFSSPAYYNGSIYYVGAHDILKAYHVASLTSDHVDNGSDFNRSDGLIANGSARKYSDRLRLTDGHQNQTGSVFTNYAVPTGCFKTEFSFRFDAPNGDGFTFTIQGNSPRALGGGGGGLGFAGLGRSVAVKFDLYNNAGEGSNSTGLYFSGQVPTIPAINLAPVNLRDTHYQLPLGWPNDTFHVKITYDGATLSVTTTDMNNTAKASVQNYQVNIPAIVGQYAFVGFTGASGGATATQDILNWTFVAPDWHGEAPFTGMRGATPSISSNGQANGIVWCIDDTSSVDHADQGHAVLRAFEAQPSNGQTLRRLYSSDSNCIYLGAYVKFTLPTIANGKVFVGTDGHLEVFGLR